MTPAYGVSCKMASLWATGDWIDVHVDDSSIGIRPVGNLVDIPDRRDTRSNIEKLVNPLRD